jgi:hypothetical protein
MATSKSFFALRGGILVVWVATMGAAFVGSSSESQILQERHFAQTSPDQRPIEVKGRTHYVTEAQYIRALGSERAFFGGCVLLAGLIFLAKKQGLK